ncbi:MAG: hypothetical protein IJU82_02525 [Ruminiclostridium sp.]|nr:hypothetical protein [Ruminiclostridium sp.]
MMYILMALGDTPAGEGFGGVLMSALLVIGTMALIYGVLVIIDRYHKKHMNDKKPSEPPVPPAPKTFPQVLDEQIKKNEDKQ